MLKNLLKKTITLGSVGVLSVGLMVATSSVASADDDPVVTITQLSESWDNNNQIVGASFSPDGTMLVVTSWVSNKVTIYSVGSDGSLVDPVDTYISDQNPGPMTFTPDGKFVSYTTNLSSQVRFLKVNPDKTLSDKIVNSAGGTANGIVFSPDGSSAVIPIYIVGNNFLSTYKVDSSGVLSDEVRTSVPNSMSSLTFSPNGKFLFGYSYGGVVTKWDVNADGTLTNRIENNVGTLAQGTIKISPDGTLLAVACDSTDVMIFHINPDGTLSDEVDTTVSSYSSYNPSSLAFSPDGKILAVGGNNYIMSLFRVNSDGSLNGKTDISIGHRPASISFSPNGKFLVSADGSSRRITMFSVQPYSAPPEAGTVGTTNVTVDSSITLTLNDDTVDLSDIPDATDVVTDDNEMNYTVTTNNLEGYTVTIKADSSTLDSGIIGNTDNIPVNLITVAQSDSQNGTGSNATALSSSNDNQLYSQNQRSVEAGDVFTSTFNLTEVPWVNADDYSGTVTYTATAN